MLEKNNILNNIYMFIVETRAKKIFYYTILIWGTIGVISILMNFSQVFNMLNGSVIKISATIFMNYINAWVSYSFYVVCVSLIIYFVAAGMHVSFDVNTFGRLNAKAMCFAPVMAIADMIGMCVCDKKFIEMGVLGWIAYFPFIIIYVILLYKLIPHYLEVKRKEKNILVISAFIGILLTTYPY